MWPFKLFCASKQQAVAVTCVAFIAFLPDHPNSSLYILVAEELSLSLLNLRLLSVFWRISFLGLEMLWEAGTRPILWVTHSDLPGSDLELEGGGGWPEQGAFLPPTFLPTRALLEMASTNSTTCLPAHLVHSHTLMPPRWWW